jgi:hypothetical protein
MGTERSGERVGKSSEREIRNRKTRRKSKNGYMKSTPGGHRYCKLAAHGNVLL